MMRQKRPCKHGRRSRRDLVIDVSERARDKGCGEARAQILGGTRTVNRADTGNMGCICGARPAVVDKVRLNHIVRARPVAREWRGVMLPWPVLFVINKNKRHGKSVWGP